MHGCVFVGIAELDVAVAFPSMVVVFDAIIVLPPINCVNELVGIESVAPIFVVDRVIVELKLRYVT